MAYVIAAPEMMTSAASDLAGIGSDLSAAHTAAASTVGLVPAAADEVSAGIAHLFSRYAHGFQSLAGQAAAFHDQFVQTLKSGGAAYAQTEATSAAGLLSLLPPGIQNDLQQLAATLAAAPSAIFGIVFFSLIAAFVTVNLAFAFLLIEVPALLMQLLMMLGL